MSDIALRLAVAGKRWVDRFDIVKPGLDRPDRTGTGEHLGTNEAQNVGRMASEALGNALRRVQPSEIVQKFKRMADHQIEIAVMRRPPCSRRGRRDHIVAREDDDRARRRVEIGRRIGRREYPKLVRVAKQALRGIIGFTGAHRHDAEPITPLRPHRRVGESGQMQAPRALIGAQDVEGAIGRTDIGGDKVLNSQTQVIVEEILDDVSFIDDAEADDDRATRVFHLFNSIFLIPFRAVGAQGRAKFGCDHAIA